MPVLVLQVGVEGIVARLRDLYLYDDGVTPSLHLGGAASTSDLYAGTDDVLQSDSRFRWELT